MVEKSKSTIESRMRGVDNAKLAAAAEAALEPELKIIDPHHHFWDFPTHRYLLDELHEDVASGHNVVATVFIECAAFYRQDASRETRVIGEVEAANGLAAMAASGRYGPLRAAAGIVGFADLTSGAQVEDVLTRQISVGGGRFKGIRHAAGWEDKTRDVHNSHTNPPQHLYRDHAKFREGFAKLGELDLSFDAWVYHPQLGDLIDLARAFPAQPIVLNHVGGPLGLEFYAERKDEVFADWRTKMTELAGCENVSVKLGGMGMPIFGFEFDKLAVAPSSTTLADAWRSYVETCIEAFGVNRCMFESNFPVDKVSGGYGNYWNAFKRLAKGASEAEKVALFHDTARDFYRLS